MEWWGCNPELEHALAPVSAPTLLAWVATAPGFHQAPSAFQLGMGLGVSVNLTLAGDTTSLSPEGLAGPTALVLCLGPLRHAGCGSWGPGDPCGTALGPGPGLGELAELWCRAPLHLLCSRILWGRGSDLISPAKRDASGTK